MVARVLPVVVLTALAQTGCGSDGDDVAHDLSTPEGAILCLEDAYRAGDVEAAVRCKDFSVEATLMLQRLNLAVAEDAMVEAAKRPQFSHPYPFESTILDFTIGEILRRLPRSG